MILRSLIAVVLLGSVANPTTSCRVSMRAVDWTEVRMMQPATLPPTAIHLEMCAALDWSYGFENTAVADTATGSVTFRTITVQASLDPSFARRFIVSTVTFEIPQLGFTLATFDGTLDFGGNSGFMIHATDSLLGTSNLAVSDPTYFMQPWPIYLRAVGSPWTATATTANSAQAFHTDAGAGLVVTYQ